MKAVVQRFLEAKVEFAGVTTGSIGLGLLVYLGIGNKDLESDVHFMVEKIVGLRIFDDESGKMNHSVRDVDGDILLVSQFTLYGSLKKGSRPSFNEAADPKKANHYYNQFKEQISKTLSKTSQAGIFGSKMKVCSENDGPVTLLLSTD
jgi:D-tyrosyl-tRNA(Tyr) deacylase